MVERRPTRISNASGLGHFRSVEIQASTLYPVTLSIDIPEATLRALGPSPSEAEGRVLLHKGEKPIPLAKVKKRLGL